MFLNLRCRTIDAVRNITPPAELLRRLGLQGEDSKLPRWAAEDSSFGADLHVSHLAVWSRERSLDDPSRPNVARQRVVHNDHVVARLDASLGSRGR